MKKLFSSLILSVFFALPFQTVSAASFSDVPENHPFYAAVESLRNLEIINGYQDGTFQPKKSVSRAEALKLVLVSAEIEVPESVEESGFTDVTLDPWYAPYTKKGKDLGIVKGYADTGKFGANDQVSKSEFLKMLFQSFQKDLSKHQDVPEKISIDTEVGQWYMPYMNYAKMLGIITPTADNKLEPGKKLTRGECADIIYKLLVIEKGGDTQKYLSLAESQLITILVSLKENNIDKALKAAESAVTYTDKALELSPDEPIVQGANDISKGFRELCYGYQSGVKGDNEALKTHAEEAKRLAGEAYGKDTSTQPLGKKIKAQADTLLSQIEEGE